MEFNYTYPPLVEQAYSFLTAKGLKIGKDKLYKKLAKAGMIDELGNPTKAALDNGLVKIGNAKDLIHQFKAAYPALMSVPDKYFRVDEQGRVLMNADGVKVAATNTLNDPAATEKQKQNALELLGQLKDY